MPQEITTEYNMENWLEATKNWKFTTYSIEGYWEMPGTIYIRDASLSKEDTYYERPDFERDLGKACRRIKKSAPDAAS
jgi:hypothetical protein